MPIWITPDGRYTFAMQTPGEGDGNSVVYDHGVPVWDRFSHEASLGVAVGVPTTPPIVVPSAPTVTAGTVFRVTNEQDGELVPRMYSYWANAVILGGSAFVFVGHRDGRPKFFEVNLETGAVTRHGARVAYSGEAEGWYWDAVGWIYLTDGPQLRRVSPSSGADEVIVDISETYPGCDLWQAHSSDDGQTHSATVRQMVSDGAYPKIGTVVCRRGKVDFYPAIGTLDESALTPDGDYLVIKDGENNYVFAVADGLTSPPRIIPDSGGALGHSDVGHGFMVGEADKPEPGGCVIWDLRTWTMRTLFATRNMGYVAVRGNVCVHSSDTHLNLVPLDGSPITPIVAHGNVGVPQTHPEYYDRRVKANLSPCGRLVCYMRHDGTRYDVFLVFLR